MTVWGTEGEAEETVAKPLKERRLVRRHAAGIRIGVATRDRRPEQTEDRGIEGGRLKRVRVSASDSDSASNAARSH